MEPSKDARMQVIHVPDLSMHSESDMQLLNHLVDEYKVPIGLRFYPNEVTLCKSLFTPRHHATIHMDSSFGF